MTSSELQIEPDLNKAPPHVEGDLLKQNTKAILGKKGWKKYYFIILKDKLQYYKRREDFNSQKDPIAFVRMSQVIEITEVIFSGVPHKSHLNSGFSVEAYHPVTQERQTFNLLAETPEGMRYWVHALRFVKAYWAKMEVRDTVLSEEQERRILEQILKEEEEDEQDEVIVGEYSLNEDSAVTTPSEETRSSLPVTVNFADGSKVKVTLSPLDTTSDLLGHVNVKDHLTSSAAQLWFVSTNGDDLILEPEDRPTNFLPRLHKFYALDPTHRVLVVFIKHKAEGVFESVAISNKATVLDVLEDRDISVKLDLKGVDNRGLFLKDGEEEHLFTNTELPCDALFQQEGSGHVVRLDIGFLLIKNKTLGGPKRTKKTSRIRTMRRPLRSASEEEKMLSFISEEEEAQSRAIDMVILKKQLMVPSALDEKSNSIESDWVDVSTSDFPSAPSPSTSRHSPSDPFPLDPINPPPLPRSSSSYSSSSSSSQQRHEDPRGFDEAVSLDQCSLPGRVQLDTSSYSRVGSRPRSNVIRAERKSPARRTEKEKSPSHSPTLEIRRRESRSKSPRRLPDRPNSAGGSGEKNSPRTSPPKSEEISPPLGGLRNRNSPLQRRNATRQSTTEKKAGKKGPPTIRLAEEKSSAPRSSRDDAVPRISTRSRSPTVRRSTKFVESLRVNDSRSSAFGASTTPPTSAKSLTTEMAYHIPRAAIEPEVEATSPDHAPCPAPSSDDEQRLDELFSRSAQLEEEEIRTRNLKTVDTLSLKYQSVARTTVATETHHRPVGKVAADAEQTPPQPLPALVINFAQLPSIQASSVGSHGDETTPSKPTAAITITSPSFLKVILLQSSEASSEAGPMDVISLSGVTLQNDRGIWRILEGNNFHDPLPFDCEDHTETIPLPGGVRAVYNHTHKRWHVLPPPLSTPVPTPTGDESRSIADSAEHEVDGKLSSPDDASLYLSKKVIITELGSAFHSVMQQFETTRDMAEKRRIGSDMTNVSMGHLVRLQLCSALARLILDGMKPYRLNGLVVDDIWKVTVAFCNEAQSKRNTVMVFPAFDKLVFQPINSLKTLMKDNNVKFRTFVCLAMSKGMLTNWLEALPKQKDVLHKHYLPHALLRLAADHEAYSLLYNQMLLALEPMLHLPFDLTVDFENRQMLEAMCAPQENGVGEGEGLGAESGRELSLDSTAYSEQSSPSLRPNVVIKTHAATGQTTTAGNVINAVWHPSPPPPSSQGGGASPDLAGKQVALKTLESQLKLPARPETTPTISKTTPTTSKATPTAAKKTSFFQKIVEQLNVGGAITGRPRDVSAPPPSRPEAVPGKQPTSKERSVVALYNSMVEDADELGFLEGDILMVKEQINPEWLICTLRGRTGIVPINYVKPVP